ncbi:MAG: choline-sulfatase [Actinomycetota bacterium]
MTDQPNLLFIQVDQLTASFLPAYGNTVAKTPHLDALAERSVVFDAAYTNFALCAPSRFSMMSGRLPSEIGAFDNGAEFPSAIPTYAHYLKASGYHTALSGKMHFVGADQLHGFDERLTIDIYPASFQWTGDWNEAGAQKHSNDARSFTLAGPVTWNPQLDYDDEVLHRARRKLYDLALGSGIDDGQPWHMTVSFTHPHDPYQCSHEHWNRYDHDEIDMPVVGMVDDPDPYSRRLRHEYGLEGIEITDEQVRTARHGYYGSVSYVDDLVGALLATLRETGFESNTVVIFSTDHGDMMGERGLWYKRTFFEGGSRIPFFVSWPERFRPSRVGANVSLVDLLPTLIDLAGGRTEPVDTPAGASLVPLCDGDATALDAGFGADIVFGENLSEGATAPILMAKRGSMKYVWSGCDPAQLFDLAADPLELINLAGSAEHADAENELHALVHRRWNVDDLTQQIVESQARRAFLRSLYAGSTAPEWRASPADQAAGRVLPEGVRYNDWVYGDVLP